MRPPDLETSRSIVANLKILRRQFLTEICPIVQNADNSLLQNPGTVAAGWKCDRRLSGMTGVVYTADDPDSSECSISRSAIARDVRSRSTIAAIAPHITATSNAIQENRVSHRSAAMPA